MKTIPFTLIAWLHKASALGVEFAVTDPRHGTHALSVSELLLYVEGDEAAATPKRSTHIRKFPPALLQEQATKPEDEYQRFRDTIRGGQVRQELDAYREQFLARGALQ